MRAAFDEGREGHVVARAALWFAVRWVAMLALALAATAAIVAAS